MSYQSLVIMAGNQSLIARIGAAAAAEGLPNPMQWAQANLWNIITSVGWDEEWDKAENKKTVNDNPDTGARNNVITDDMIQAAVQALNEPPAPPA